MFFQVGMGHSVSDRSSSDQIRRKFVCIVRVCSCGQARTDPDGRPVTNGGRERHNVEWMELLERVRQSLDVETKEETGTVLPGYNCDV